MTSSWGVELECKVSVEIKHGYPWPLETREGVVQEGLQLLPLKLIISKQKEMQERQSNIQF